MFSLAFWYATAERAIRTAAQALAALLGADTVNWLEVDWPYALATAGGAALLAVLTAVATSGAGAEGPGVTETTVPPRTRGPRAPDAGR
jgi:hypothetical protein